MDLLDKYSFIRSDNSCGTYIHISSRGHYTLNKLKYIAKTVIYYKSAKTSIMSSEQKFSLWSRSNMSESSQLKQVYDNAQI